MQSNPRVNVQTMKGLLDPITKVYIYFLLVLLLVMRYHYIRFLGSWKIHLWKLILET